MLFAARPTTRLQQRNNYERYEAAHLSAALSLSLSTCLLLAEAIMHRALIKLLVAAAAVCFVVRVELQLTSSVSVFVFVGFSEAALLPPLLLVNSLNLQSPPKRSVRVRCNPRYTFAGLQAQSCHQARNPSEMRRPNCSPHGSELI